MSRSKPRPLRLLSPDDVVVPPVPIGLSKRGVAAWTAYWSSPLGRVVLPGLDADGVETLLKLRDERDAALRVARRHRVVAGSQGQPVMHPLFAHAESLQRLILQSEDRLGLNPRARLMLGVLLGDATRSIGDANADFERDEFADLLADRIAVEGGPVEPFANVE